MPIEDSADCYELAQAARLLRAGPRWVARQLERRTWPGRRTAGGWTLPRAWVDAQAGRTAVDAEALRHYWIERLAPPSAHAARARRPRAALAARALLGAAEAARRLCATEAALGRLGREGALPALKVDGTLCYDAALVEALAEAAAVPPEAGALARAAARAEEVRALAAYEYRSEAPPTAPPAGEERADAPGPAPPAPAPAAWSIPADLYAGDGPAPPAPRLIEADGFETVVEDE